MIRLPKAFLIGGPKPEGQLTMAQAVELIDKVIKIQNADTDTPVIDIDGFIGDLFWEESKNTVKAIKAKLKEISKLKATKIIVNINSPGGFVDAGLGIHDILAAHKAEIETNVSGLTASMATIIAQSGDTRRMSDNALFLIHQPMHGSFSNVTESEQRLEELIKVNDRIVRIYDKRNEISSEDEIRDLMNESNGNGKWIDADEALELGFIDEIFEPMATAAAILDPEVKATLRLPNVPEGKFPKPASNATDNLITNDMKKELLALLAKLTGLLTIKKEGSAEGTITDEAQAVIDDLQAQIDEVGTQEDKVTKLEGDIETITDERDTAAASLATSVTDLTTANDTIATLESDLVKAKAASTKAPGKQGLEDPDKPQSEEDAGLSKDAESLKNRFNQTSG